MIISGVGRLGRDAEVRYTPSGMAVANLSVSFNFYKKNEHGNRESQWLDLALWGKQAEVLAQYLTKGTQIDFTAADPHIEYYTKADGTQHGKLVANIINIQFVGSTGAYHVKDTVKTKPESKTIKEYNDHGLPIDGFEDDIPFN